MGYTTDFSGKFDLNKELSPKMKQYLTLLTGGKVLKPGKSMHLTFLWD